MRGNDIALLLYPTFMLVDTCHKQNKILATMSTPEPQDIKPEVKKSPGEQGCHDKSEASYANCAFDAAKKRKVKAEEDADASVTDSPSTSLLSTRLR
jgi:hypothetical protein